MTAASGSTKDDRSSISDQAFHCSASSVESLPSASGSSETCNTNLNNILNIKLPAGTQALVRSGSPNSSLSADDGRSTIVPICRAKAVVDSAPFPYEKDALKFKVNFSFPCFSPTLIHIIDTPPPHTVSLVHITER